MLLMFISLMMMHKHKKILSANQVRTYVDNTTIQLIIQLATLSINSVNITSVENIIKHLKCYWMYVTPSSNDVVPVRNQIVNIDVTNSTFTIPLIHLIIL